MIKRLFSGTMFLAGLSMLALVSCKKDNDPAPAKPTVKITEIGSHDSPDGKVAAGADLHLEAEIAAEGLIAKIAVEIHQEEGGSFEIEKTFGTDSKYAELKNADFHEHIDIPAAAPLGEYHLHLTVTDKLGQTTTAEAELIVEAAPVNITITGLTFGAGHDFPDNRIAYVGTAPVIEVASVTAENGIDSLFVELHSESGTAFEIDTTFAYAGEKELTAVHKHINIPANAPAGDYHLHFKVYDKNGKSKEETMEIEIKETGIKISNLEIGSSNSAAASNIHTEFDVSATDALKAIRIRIYKAETPAAYVFNETFTSDFEAGNVKAYNFHKHLDATGAAAGKYVIEIIASDSKGAYIVLKEQLTITQ
jgi:hypothetical protein